MPSAAKVIQMYYFNAFKSQWGSSNYMTNEPTGALYQIDSNSPSRWDVSGYGWGVQRWGTAMPWCACANVDMQEVTAAIIGVCDLYMERNSFHSQLHKWDSLHFPFLLKLRPNSTLKETTITCVLFLLHHHLIHDLFIEHNNIT